MPIARSTFASRSRRSATVAVATYGISWAIAISGALLPCPKTLPGSGPTACVVAVRAAGGALADHAHVLAALRLQRGGDTARDGRRVAEQRVDPRELPRALGIGRGEHLEAARRVGRDQAPVAGPHRRVERVTRAERLAAALA